MRLVNVSHSLAPVVVLAITVFGLYAQVLHHEYILRDTNQYLITNPHVHSLGWENLIWAFGNQHGLWAPLTWLSYAVTSHFFGLDLYWHHLANVLLHFLNVVVFYYAMRLLIRLHEEFYPSSGLGFKPYHLAISLFAALLFAIHPQHVESVAWLAERKGLLASLFMQLSLVFYLLYGANTETKIKSRYYGLMLVSTVLALMSKPIAVSLPVLMLLLDIYPLKRISFTQVTRGMVVRVISEKLVIFIAVIAVVFVGIVAQAEQGALYSIANMGVMERLLNAFANIWLYLTKFLLPIGLSPIYPFPAYAGYEQYSSIYLPVIAVLAVTGLCIYGGRKSQVYWFVAWGFYLMSLMPTIGLVQVGDAPTADRFSYFPTIPLYVVTAFLLLHAWVYASWQKKTALIFLVSGVLALLVVGSVAQAKIWKNEFSFWRYLVVYNPADYRGHAGLGNFYSWEGRYENAIYHFQKAIQIHQENRNTNFDAGIYLKLSRIYIEISKYDAAIPLCHEVLDSTDSKESRVDAFYWLSYIHFMRGEFKQGRAWVEKGLALNGRDQHALILRKKIIEKME